MNHTKSYVYLNPKYIVLCTLIWLIFQQIPSNLAANKQQIPYMIFQQITGYCVLSAYNYVRLQSRG